MTQHVRPPQNPPEVSDLAPLNFKWERFSEIGQEFLPVWKQHWQEVGVFKEENPFDPNWDLYFGADIAGNLHVLTVRDGSLLVGYVFNFIFPHPHFMSTPWATVDGIWLHPAYRAGWTGVKMLIENERGLRLLGVKMLSIAEKVTFKNHQDRRLQIVLKRLGYKPMDLLHAKYIGD
jgi:hypothetical protein